jgi:hypothetical protein
MVGRSPLSPSPSPPRAAALTVRSTKRMGLGRARSRIKLLSESMVWVKRILCGLSVEAMVATVPMAYVHIMPLASIHTEERKRSKVLWGVTSPSGQAAGVGHKGGWGGGMHRESAAGEGRSGGAGSGGRRLVCSVRARAQARGA